MRAILVQQRVSKAPDDPKTFPDDLKQKPSEIDDINEIAHSSIILHLSDNIVRQVDNSKTAREIWDRERRQAKPNPKYQSLNHTEYALVSGEAIECTEPLTYDEAVSCTKSKEWLEAMREEMQSLLKMETWKLVFCPQHQRLIQSKWLYKLKDGTNSNDAPRYKARLVAKGFS
ncbi:Retrovirus-related Pol polyprotein from transposon TNT 1-94 [Abeliophyllum distichum]|uniref:Retrovirus-related Pol polyprotein from transposon TNT 1-94 n=1 Tax=Abeliophyllum distichum TaxID=126358 RepID=A0ABD1TKM2_9LAMI